MYVMLLLLNIINDILNTKRRSNIAPIAKNNITKWAPIENFNNFFLAR